jgi:hypothetical protein
MGAHSFHPSGAVVVQMLGAGVATEAHQKNKLERVAGYITRPPVAIERLSLTP